MNNADGAGGVQGPQQEQESGHEEPQEPQEYVIDGERYTEEQLREMREAHNNRTRWQSAYAQRDQELAQRRDRTVARETELSRYQESLLGLQQQLAAQAAQAAARPEPEPREEPLPDPGQDPDGYLRALGERQRTLERTLAQERRAAPEREKRIRDELQTDLRAQRTDEMIQTAKQDNVRMSNAFWHKYQNATYEQKQAVADWVASERRPDDTGRYREDQMQDGWDKLYGQQAGRAAIRTAVRQTARSIAKPRVAVAELGQSSGGTATQRQIDLAKQLATPDELSEFLKKATPQQVTEYFQTLARMESERE